MCGEVLHGFIASYTSSSPVPEHITSQADEAANRRLTSCVRRTGFLSFLLTILASLDTGEFEQGVLPRFSLLNKPPLDA
jgi:hypothetical protein